ncbi:suppressor of fused domain protein [Steroidobacter flavus]|uniref:Suppressor of fused domain protein n=1 Tax=Steroidobacter flavus TaxID=1842136 RepID=A0ABV8STL1_9GAMM
MNTVTSRDMDEHQYWWNARLRALERMYGKADSAVGHSPVPFSFGADEGGAADVLYFRNHAPGVLSVTAELIGTDGQARSSLGNYELAICHRSAETWGSNLISRLAYHTLETPLEPGETMDIGPIAPDGSGIAALLFEEYGRFEIEGRKAGVLLCIGITEEELKWCLRGQSAEIVQHLKARSIFPFTDFGRQSVVAKKKSWDRWWSW